jgi:hypothetical protein
LKLKNVYAGHDKSQEAQHHQEMAFPGYFALRLNVGRGKFFLRDLVQKLVDDLSFQDVYRFCRVD